MSESSTRPAVNNLFYDELGERWYNDDEHIIALLRAESRLKLNYVQRVLENTEVYRNRLGGTDEKLQIMADLYAPQTAPAVAISAPAAKSN